MTDRLRAAAQAALDALINGKNVRAGEGGTKRQSTLEDAAIEQLRAALAEPEVQQEPVAWGRRHSDGRIADCIAPGEYDPEPRRYTVPLYAAPPRREWQSLTEEEVKSLWEFPPELSWIESVHTAIRRADALLKEKNGGGA